MDNRLKRVFDYQRFQNNARLAQIITDTLSRYGTELDDEDLSFVSAAGGETIRQHGKNEGDSDV
ncbi:MAG: hypothetical protein LUF78_07775 [Clostridiales bacterium]|nr:hypothetical protein [Clostridiales bacterium]MCD8154565.1 hypothetical protein [Clostridiales bacterium]